MHFSKNKEIIYITTEYSSVSYIQNTHAQLFLHSFRIVIFTVYVAHILHSFTSVTARYTRCIDHDSLMEVPV